MQIPKSKTAEELLEDIHELRQLINETQTQLDDSIDKLIPAEVKQKIADMKAEFSPMFEALVQELGEADLKVRDLTLKAGCTLNSKHMMAVFNKGRVTWDGRALDGYAKAHPELNQFRKEGSPSIAIREVVQKS